MIKKRGFLRIYLFMALAMGFITLLDSILKISNINANTYFMIAFIMLLIFFFINIISLFIFVHNHLGKISLVLPVYHIISFISFSALGANFYLKEMLNSEALLVMAIFSMMGAFFEILFSLYLIGRFKLWTKKSMEQFSAKEEQ